MKKSISKNNKKYHFSNSINKSVDIRLIKKNVSFFETLKEWIVFLYKKLLYFLKHNRIQFLLILSIIFIIGFYLYNKYNETSETKEKNEEGIETLDNFIKKTQFTGLKKKKKTIPKKHESRCRFILENIFRCSFITIRPDFLKYPKSGKNLELDMYNSDLKLALEYDGIHHRKYTEFFHKSKQDFIDQQDRDNFKEDKCKELGITLIRVPDTIKYENLEEYIKNELDTRGIFYIK